MTGYDAIIIGAGSVGTTTAYFLSKEGYKVLVLEENASAGQGQNKAAIGGVRATHSDPAKISLCKKSLEIFSGWEREHGVDIGWKKGGYCFPVYRETEESMLKGILPIQKKHNLNIEWLDHEGIIQSVPGINRTGLIGGTLSPDDGQVSPLLFSEAVVNASMDMGCEFKWKTQVKDIINDGERVTGVKTTKGEFFADTIVNASGANATEIGRMVGLDIPVIPDSHEGGISAPVKPFLDPLLVDLRPGPMGMTSNFYFGQTHTGAFIFCYTPIKPIIGTDRRTTSDFMPVIARRLVDLIPRLKNLTVRRLWRGLYPMTPDGVAIVGKSPNVDGFYMAIGMCGQGLMLGPGVGYELTNYIKTEKTHMSKEIFDTLSPGRNFYAGTSEKLK